MPETADAVIIGAGIHGASLAFHLAQRGLKPVILEKRFVAAGATGRSSGLVRMHYDLEPESALAWASYRYFSRWDEIVGGDCGVHRTGCVGAAPPSRGWHWPRRSASRAAGAGAPEWETLPGAHLPVTTWRHDTAFFI